MSSTILAAMLPVLITITIGYAWVRSGRSLDSSALAPLIADVGTPGLVLHSLLGQKLPPSAFVDSMLGILLALSAFAALGWVLLRALGLDRSTWLPSLIFPNAGNLGLPLVLYAFGREGLGYGVIGMMICSVGNYTVGNAIAAGRLELRGMLRLPVLWAALLGLAGTFAGFTPPPWLDNTLGLLAGMTVPVMLLMLGAALGRLRVLALRRMLGLSLFRLACGVAIGIAITSLLGMQGLPRSVLILQCSMPVAVYSYLLAQLWRTDPEQIAALVMVSTVLTLFATPVLLAFLLPA